MDKIIKVWVINKAVEMVKSKIYKNEIVNKAKSGAEKFDAIAKDFWEKLEDYILKEIEKNPNTQYEIYTFFSGAAITMKDFPNLNVYAIKPTSLPKDYFLNPVQKLYQQVGIQILEFKDK